MKLRQHERSAKPESMTLTTAPMTVWLSRTHELIIEKGDTLQRVADVIEEHWGLARAEARQLAAFWFALGERQANKQRGARGWTRSELLTTPGRRYLRR
jgi:hypothetical protein